MNDESEVLADVDRQKVKAHLRPEYELDQLVRIRHCEICGEVIPRERAEALAETRLCIKHATEIQKLGGEFTMTATEEVTSKTGSFKKNYGGIDVSKRRNMEAIETLRDAYTKKK